MAQIEAEIGPIDILVSNAGIRSRGPFETVTLKDWNLLLKTDLQRIRRGPRRRRKDGDARLRPDNQCLLDAQQVGLAHDRPIHAGEGRRQPERGTGHATGLVRT